MPGPPPSLQTCSGAVACQIFDCLHPGSINMSKVWCGGHRQAAHGRQHCHCQPGAGVALRCAGGSCSPCGAAGSPPLKLRCRCTCLQPLPQVDFNYRNEVDFLKNYKELQKAFDSVSCPKASATAAAGAGAGLHRSAAALTCSLYVSLLLAVALLRNACRGHARRQRCGAQPSTAHPAHIAGVQPLGAEQGQAAGQQRVHAGGAGGMPKQASLW